MRGSVEVFLAQTGRWEKAQTAQVLAANQVIRTGPGSQVSLLLDDESVVKLGANTRFAIRAVAPTSGWSRLRGLTQAVRAQARSAYQLFFGRFWMRNKNRAIQIDVETPTITAAVRGTEFTLEQAREGTTLLTTFEGQVLAASRALPADKLLVNPGEQLVADPGRRLRKQVLIRSGESIQWVLRVPQLMSPTDMPLVSPDYVWLRARRAELRSTVRTSGMELELRAIQRDLGQCDAISSDLKRRSHKPAGHPRRLIEAWCALDEGGAKKALQLLESAQFANEPLAWLARVAANYQLNQFGRARVVSDQALARFPDSVGLRVQSALLDLNTGNLDSAHRALEENTEDLAGSITAWQARTLLALAQSQPERARTTIAQAHKLSAGAPRTWLLKAHTEQAEFDLSAAIDSARQASGLEPRYLAAHLFEARLLLGDAREKEALALLRRVRALGANSAEFYSINGYLLLQRNARTEASESFKRAIAIEPSLGEPYVGLALIAMKQGRLAEALERLTTATALEPQRALFLSYWGKVLHEDGRHEKALEVLRRSAELDPRDPTPWLYQAIILRDLNRLHGAIDALNRAAALNDNRAVYRSRFLLDRDQAVNTVQLSELFADLGLNTWARAQAARSLKHDYRNHAGHLFFAGSLSEEPDRNSTFASEQLLARMLMPATLNSFNLFNDYTSLLERPKFGGTARLAGGNQAHRDAEIIVYGAAPDARLAYQAGAFYEHTDGFRASSFETTADGAVVVKWEPTPDDGVLMTFSQSRLKQGDELLRRFEVDAPADADQRTRTRLSRLELGYHRRLGPRTDALMFASRIHTRVDGFDETNVFSDPTFVDIDRLEGSRVERTGHHVQPQLLGTFGNHTLIAGVLWHHAELRERLDSTLQVTPAPGVPIAVGGPIRTLTNRATDVAYLSGYLHDIWNPFETLTIEGGVNWDRLRVGGLEETGLHPRLGMDWQIAKGFMLRAAAFQYFATLIDARLDPTEISGMPIFRNLAEGTKARELKVRVEREWNQGIVGVGAHYLAHIVSRFAGNGLAQIDGAGAPQRFHGRRYGVEGDWNQLLPMGLAFSARGQHFLTHDDTDQASERTETQIVLRLRHQAPRGWFVGVSETFRHLDFRNPRNSETMWITDFDVGYEFAKKRGEIRLEVRNAFNSAFNWVTDRLSVEGRTPSREVVLGVSWNF